VTAHLNDELIDEIVRVIDGWSGQLTWEELRESVAIRIGHCPTRQGLDRHRRIKKAFQKKQKLIREGRPELKVGSVEVQKLQESNDRLKSENLRLTDENNNLLDQFRRWAYNASIAGISYADLNEALPQVDREHAK
jgi:hypothetical protein